MIPDDSQPHVPLVIIGAGIAGRVACSEAIALGIVPILLDDGVVSDANGAGDSSGVSVLSLSNRREILWTQAAESGTFVADRVILATGGSPRIIPFPGSNLPGIYATLRPRPQDVRGRKAVVAGCGPRLIEIASELSKNGAEVLAVLDVASSTSVSSKHWTNFNYQSGQTVFFASGDGKVERLGFGPVDRETWSPLLGQTQEIVADLVVLDFGDHCRSELATIAGCATSYDEQFGCRIPVRDEQMRTTVPGILFAGDGSGVAWKSVAEREGRIAAISAAEDLGMLTSAMAENRRAEIDSRFHAIITERDQIEAVCAFRPGLLDLVQAETVVCRCEGVCVGKVQAAIEGGAVDMNALKFTARIGMGECQGRECLFWASAFLSRTIGAESLHKSRIQPRPPARPVSFGALSRMQVGKLPILSGPMVFAEEGGRS